MVTVASPVRRGLVDRVKLTVSAGMVCGIAGIALSNAGGPSAALLDAALLCLALWLGRSSFAAAVTNKPSGASMTGNQALLLVLALGGAAVLIAAGAASRPLHGLAVAPFAMAAFALSSQNSRDLRSGVLAGAASLLVLSSADDHWLIMALCAIGLVPMVFGWATVRQLMFLDRNPELTLTVERARRPWPWALVARLVVVTAALALLMPSEPMPHPQAGDGSQSGPGTPPPGERGNAIAGGGALDLRQRGSLDSAPVIDVPPDSETLWQGGFVDQYNGASWGLTYDRGAQNQWVSLPASHPQGSATGYLQAVVRRLGPGPLGVYAPGPVVGVNAPAGVLFWVPGAISVNNRTNPLAPYLVDYLPSGSSTMGTISQSPVNVTGKRWLQLPTELPSRVRDLARTVTASSTTTQDKVVAVEDYLRTHEKYSLDSPVPAEGKDAVDAFLFTDHVGFCEQFASAEAVMLRSLGIPTRVATGFGGPGVVKNGRRIYRNADAHAWVQVGYPGERWIDSDPTAGSQLAPATAKHRLMAWLKKLWKTLTGTTTARRLTALGLLVGAVVIVLLLRVARRLRPRRRKSLKDSPPAPLQTAAGKAYQRLLTRLAAQGRPRLPTETVRDVLFRLGARDADVVVTLLESEWYGPPTVYPEQMIARVVAVLDALASEALATASP